MGANEFSFEGKTGEQSKLWRSDYVLYVRGLTILAIISLVNETARELNMNQRLDWDVSLAMSVQRQDAKPYLTQVS